MTAQNATANSQPARLGPTNKRGTMCHGDGGIDDSGRRRVDALSARYSAGDGSAVGARMLEA